MTGGRAGIVRDFGVPAALLLALWQGVERVESSQNELRQDLREYSGQVEALMVRVGILEVRFESCTPATQERPR